MTTFVKKLNRALLLVLLAAGVLCCPLPASAAAYEVDAQIPVSVDVTENYQTTFTLQLTAEDDAPLPAQTRLTFTGGGSGVFGPIHYTAPGDYRYQVTQEAGIADHVTYDTSAYTVTVRVTDTADGGLQADVWARHNESEGKSEVVAFHNSYVPPETGTSTSGEQTAAAGATPSATPAPAGGILPQTGDTFPLTVLALVCVAAAVCLGVLLWHRKKHSES